MKLPDAGRRAAGGLYRQAMKEEGACASHQAQGMRRYYEIERFAAGDRG